MTTNPSTTLSTRNLIRAGVSRAFESWIAYALVECWVVALVPWLMRPAHEYLPSHVGFTVILFALYACIGALLGLLAGNVVAKSAWYARSLSSERASIILSSFATATVVLAYLLNLTVNFEGPLGRSELPMLSTSILLLVALVVGSTSKIWYERLRCFTNPWTASILLLFGPWVIRGPLRASPVFVKALAAVVFPAAVVLMSAAIARLRRARSGNDVVRASLVVDRRNALWMTAAVAVTIVLSAIPRQAPLIQDGVTAAARPGRNDPNVILVVMDTVRADHLSLHGYERDTTPNLRELAAEATFYERALAPGDMTLPTHASIFTGLYASRHHAHLDPPAFGMGRPLGDDSTTLAEILASVGYGTWAVIANSGYVTSYFGFAQGFRHFDQRSPVLLLEVRNPILLRKWVRDIAAKIVSPQNFSWYRSAEEINEQVFEVLDSAQERREPLFLFINYMDAHWPYAPPAPYDDLYPGRDPSFTLPKYVEMHEQVLRLEREMTPRERDHLVSQYDGEIAYLDRHIGELIAELKRRGMYDNTLLIVTSDHGEALGDRNLVGHMVSVYQDQVSVHLLVKYPHQTVPTVVSEPISLVDLMPTILDVLEVDSPAGLDGRSLLQPESRGPRFLITESFPSSYHLGLHSRFDRIERAVVFGTQKLVTSTAGKREMYDLSKDPDERTDLYGRDEMLANDLEESLRQWLLQVSVPDSEPDEIDEQTLERLRSLGYIQ